MQARPENWRSIVASKNFWLKVVAVINNVTYTEITAPVIERSLFSGELSIGNCVAASCTFSVRANSADIPKSAKVEIKVQVCRDDPASPTTPVQSDQLSVGTFYVYTRNENKDIGLVTLQCYDVMLKANQLYITNPTADPESRTDWAGGKSMAACVTEIAARLGVSVDSRTRINSGQNYKIQYPAHFIQSTNVNTETGTETTTTEQTSNYTMADVLHLIGAVHGGNWVITPANELRLIPLIRPPSTSTSRDGSTASGNPVQMAVNVPIVIGKVTTGKQITVSRITVTRAEKEVYTKGNDTGFTLHASGSQYETVALHETAKNDLYTSFNGLTYNPYTVEQACMDPCAELGDQVYIKAQSESNARVLSVICSHVMTFGTDFRVNLSAPAKVETESEYPFLTQTQKLRGELEKLQATSESFIEQTNNRIALEVTRRQNADSALSSSIELTADQIALEVTNRENADSALSSRIQQNAEQISLKVSKTNLVQDLNSELTITNNAITVSTGHFIVNGNADPRTVNFKLDSNGNFWANNAHLTSVTASGSFSTSTTSGGTTYSTVTDAGEISLRKNGTEAAALSIWSSAYPINTHSNAIDAATLHLSTMPFVVGTQPDSDESSYDWYYRFIVKSNRYQLGFNEWVYADSLFVSDHIRFNSANGPEISCGTGGKFLVGTESNKCGLSVWGDKQRVVRTESYGVVGMNAMESATAVFSDIGSGILDESGMGYVFITPDFAETVDLSHSYQVFLTQTSDGGIGWVQKEFDHFVVHGEPGTSFDWIIYAKQKDYTNTRMEPVGSKELDLDLEAGEFPQLPDDTVEENAMEYLKSYEEEIYGHDN